MSNAKLRKLGVSLAEPRIDVMGAWTVPCGNCAAPLPVEPLVESIECAHCGASSRLRLDGVNRYRAHGLTEDQARTQIALERAVATRDVGAALEAVSATAAQLAPHGTPAHRQLVFSNARMQFAWLEGAGELDAASRLGLGPPTQCKTCDSRVALAPEGAGNCPVCQQPV